MAPRKSTTLAASTSFTTEINGVEVQVHAGVTRVRADHPLAKRVPEYFEPDDANVARAPR
jgi:hypothetical protein